MLEEYRSFERYPVKYKPPGGGEVVWFSASISHMHEKYLRESYFPTIGSVRHHANYNNKRAMDPFVKGFMDEKNISVSKAWQIPTLNEEASYKSFAKYGKPVKPMTEKQVQQMNRAWAWTENHFGPFMRDSKVSSYDEAVAGLDTSTSTGYPFNKVFAKKRELLEQDLEFKNFMEQDWEALKKYCWTCIATSSLKEELRTEEKILDNSIRTFIAMPIDATIHGKRLFDEMNEKFYASYLHTASVVGMSPYDGNWDTLYNKLRKFPTGWDLDESQYDSSLREYMMWGCANFRFNMLRKEDRTLENRQRIQVYYRNLIHTCIITPEGVLVMKKGGNPSGGVNTIVDNTIILFALLAYAWIVAHDSAEVDTTYDEFMNNTALALVGDDNTFTVAPISIQIYNARSIIAIWKDLGVTTTCDSLDARPLDQLSFLSAKFYNMKGIMVPVYDRNKLMTTLLYSPYKEQSPALALERVAGILGIGWCDEPLRNFCWNLITYLRLKYGRTLINDPHWNLAITQIKTDPQYRAHFVGELLTQSINTGELRERNNSSSEKEHTNLIMANITVTPKTNNPKRRNRKPQQARSQRNKPWGFKPNPNGFRRANTRGPGRRPQRNRKRGRGMERTGNSNGSTFGGPVVTNTRKSEPARIEQFDERIGTVTGSVGLGITRYSINPGDANTFPRTCAIAKLYEKYEFLELEFYYKHDVSQFATQGQTGLVYLNCFYDASTGAPTSSIQLADSFPVSMAMPNQDIRLRLDKRAMNGSFDHFVRPGVKPGGTDIKMYDVGMFYISTEGMQNTSEIGKLHVRGKVKLMTRILNAPDGTGSYPLNNTTSVYQGLGSQVLSDSSFTSTIFDTVILNGLNILHPEPYSFIPPPGQYLVFISVDFQSSGDADYQIKLLKNGVTITPALLQPVSTISSTVCTLYLNRVISSTGLDVFTVASAADYGVLGTGFCNGQIIFQSL